jgi:hypothetical protein
MSSDTLASSKIPSPRVTTSNAGTTVRSPLSKQSCSSAHYPPLAQRLWLIVKAC